jgi:predicted ATPase/DNA-binding winged helix-turn-helix (wHTH) protein
MEHALRRANDSTKQTTVDRELVVLGCTAAARALSGAALPDPDSRLNGGVLGAGGSAARDFVSFGPFRLYPAERLIEKDGVPVHMGGRALDILLCLVDRAGQVVGKRELIATVWADVIVDESSLRFHVAALRKALGDGQAGARYITSVSGRGYCLVAPLTRSETAPSGATVRTAVVARAETLPMPLATMVGREHAVQDIKQEVAARRFVTVVGHGGIGKTTVAVAVAHELLLDFDGAIHFLDLGPLADARFVASALATQLGLMVHSDDPVPHLLAALQDRRMLLILDSCEHVIDGVAPLAESIFKRAPHVHMLATSRESLRVEGERVHRLFPLDCPPEDAGLGTEELLTYSAAQLFIKRASASANLYEPCDADAPLIAQICAKLDGIALALELAAGRVDAFGVQGVADLLASRFGLLWQGKRTALPRHQTLTATLDWSYDLLSDVDRLVLRRLAVFVGAFPLDAAQSIAVDDSIDKATALEALAELVAKSLVSQVSGSAPVRYRLLDMTRAYVLEKPMAAGDADAIARRHAAYCCQYLDRVEADSWDARTDGLTGAREFLGNVRAALDWCFSPHGDRAVGLDLAARASRLFIELSLLTECGRWAGQALALLDDALTGTRSEMQLQTALGVSLMFTEGNTDKVRVAFDRALALAEALDDLQYQLRLLSAMNLYVTRVADFRSALALGQRSVGVAKRLGDPAALLMADWMQGVAHHLLGDQASARALCQSAMQRTPTLPWRNILRFGYDRRIIALVALTRALWLGGCPVQAADAARFTVGEAAALGNPVTLCIAMIWTTHVFLWNGDWASSEDIIARIISHAAKHSLGPYHAVGLGLRGELLIRRGEVPEGIALTRSCLETLTAHRHLILSSVFTTNLAEAMAAVGRLDEAMTMIDVAASQVGGAGAAFDLPEVLRVKGDILWRQAPYDTAAAEDCLRRSLDCARAQSAPGWELRAAVTLTRLWLEQGRAAEAHALLAPVYAKFAEGLDTADPVAARRLLDALPKNG